MPTFIKYITLIVFGYMLSACHMFYAPVTLAKIHSLIPENEHFLYVNGSTDIPLYPGLRKDKTATPLIANQFIYRQNKIGPQPIETFYRDSLPVLGWKTSGDLVYTREEETLYIEIKLISRKKPYTQVVFTLEAPKTDEETVASPTSLNAKDL